MFRQIMIFLLILLSFQTALAVQVGCGRPYTPNNIFTGDYIFTNNENTTVRVFIDNRFTIVSIYPGNIFYLAPNESKIISFRAYTGMAQKMFVTYLDTSNGFSASVECTYYAMPDGSYLPVLTTTTTTTTIPVQNYSCENKGFFTCMSLPGCHWVGNLFSGYCRSIYNDVNITATPTTTTTPITTTQTTTTPIISQTPTTTTINLCSSLNFWQCQNNPNCKWSGDFRLGRCISVQTTVATSTTTTLTTSTSTTTTTTLPTTTTTVCTNVCNRWLRLVCLEWKTICIL